MSDRYGNDDTGKVAIGVITILFMVFSLGYGGLKCSANVDGSAQEKATQEAQAFAAQAYPGATVACSGGDSDGDGYVTCSVFPQGDDHRPPFSIQCVTAYAMSPWGCKLTNAITNPQNLK